MPDERKPISRTMNINIKTLYQKFLKLFLEVWKCNSSNVSMISEYDLTRIRKYLSDLKAYMAYVQKAPLADLPESSPQIYNLEGFPVLVDVENVALTEFLTMVDRFAYEILSSQSAQYSLGLIEPDFLRLENYLKKLENIIEYFESEMPLDYPESSPRKGITPHGEQGIGSDK